MAVAFIDFPVTVSGEGERLLPQLTRILTQPHGPALAAIHLLIVHQVDDGVRCIRFKLGTIRILEIRHATGKINHCRVHAQANTQIGNFVLAGKPRRFDLSFKSAITVGI